MGATCSADSAFTLGHHAEHVLANSAPFAAQFEAPSRLDRRYHASMFSNPSPAAIRALLKGIQTIAVVGFSPKPERASYRVAQAMQAAGYRVIPIRPGLAEGLGERAYPSLEALPWVPDLVDVFRAPEAVPAIVDSCIALGVKALWLQEGVIHEQAAAKAVEAGLFVVMDRCLWKEWAAMRDEES